jgi:hypothetical protein
LYQATCGNARTSILPAPSVTIFADEPADLDNFSQAEALPIPGFIT